MLTCFDLSSENAKPVATDLLQLLSTQAGLSRPFVVSTFIDYQCSFTVSSLGFPFQPTDQEHVKKYVECFGLALELQNKKVVTRSACSSILRRSWSSFFVRFLVFPWLALLPVVPSLLRSTVTPFQLLRNQCPSCLWSANLLPTSTPSICGQELPVCIRFIWCLLFCVSSAWSGSSVSLIRPLLPTSTPSAFSSFLPFYLYLSPTGWMVDRLAWLNWVLKHKWSSRNALVSSSLLIFQWLFLFAATGILAIESSCVLFHFYHFFFHPWSVINLRGSFSSRIVVNDYHDKVHRVRFLVLCLFFSLSSSAASLVHWGLVTASSPFTSLPSGMHEWPQPNSHSLHSLNKSR